MTYPLNWDGARLIPPLPPGATEAVVTVPDKVFVMGGADAAREYVREAGVDPDTAYYFGMDYASRGRQYKGRRLNPTLDGRPGTPYDHRDMD